MIRKIERAELEAVCGTGYSATFFVAGSNGRTRKHMASCDVKMHVPSDVRMIESSRQLRCHCPAKSSIFRLLSEARTTKQFSRIGHQRSWCPLIDDVLSIVKTHRNDIGKGLFLFMELLAPSQSSSCSAVVQKRRAASV